MENTFINEYANIVLTEDGLDNIEVVECPETKHLVLFSIIDEMCLHNDSIEEDLEDVKTFQSLI